MSKSGFRSITVTEESYVKFESFYNKLKRAGKLPIGIHSFSGYVTYNIENYTQEKEALLNLASKIMVVPTKFTDNKITIKVTR